MSEPPKQRPSIDALERMIDRESASIEILPNGDVVVGPAPKRAPEILTRRLDLGSNY